MMKPQSWMVEESFPKSIESLFRVITDRVKEHLNPDLLIAAGSFGKGSWIYDEGVLLSDFELVFVCPKPWSLAGKKRLQADLNRELKVDISLKGYLSKNVQNRVISNYSTKNPGYIDLPFFDAFSKPRILYENQSISPFSFPVLAIEDVPEWEAWRLIVNRLGDLLTLHSTSKTKASKDYLWLKAFESCVDSFLIVNKKYNSGIESRHKSFNKYDFGKSSELVRELVHDSSMLLTSAINCRKNHDISNFNIDEVDEAQRLKLICRWVEYFSQTMLKSENITSLQEYSRSKILQSKYLETNFGFNIVFSNLIRLIRHRGSFNGGFKFHSLGVSWRHIILLIVQSTFVKLIAKKVQPESVDLFGEFIFRMKGESWEGDEYIARVIKYWKILR